MSKPGIPVEIAGAPRRKRQSDPEPPGKMWRLPAHDPVKRWERSSERRSIPEDIPPATDWPVLQKKKATCNAVAELTQLVWLRAKDGVERVEPAKWSRLRIRT